MRKPITMGRAAYIVLILLFSAGGPVWGSAKFESPKLSPSSLGSLSLGSHQNSGSDDELEEEIEKAQDETEERINRTIELGESKSTGSDSSASKTESEGSSGGSDNPETKQADETKSLASLLTIENLLKEAEGEKAKKLSDLANEKLEDFLSKADSEALSKNIETINTLLEDKDTDGEEAEYLRDLKKKFTDAAREKSSGDSKSDLISNLMKDPAKTLKDGLSSLSKTASDYIFGGPKGGDEKASLASLSSGQKASGEQSWSEWFKGVALPKEGRTWGEWIQDVAGGTNPNDTWTGWASKNFGTTGEAVAGAIVSYGRRALDTFGGVLFGEAGKTAASAANLINDEKFSAAREVWKEQLGFRETSSRETPPSGNDFGNPGRHQAEVDENFDFSLLGGGGGNQSPSPQVISINSSDRPVEPSPLATANTEQPSSLPARAAGPGRDSTSVESTIGPATVSEASGARNSGGGDSLNLRGSNLHGVTGKNSIASNSPGEDSFAQQSTDSKSAFSPSRQPERDSTNLGSAQLQNAPAVALTSPRAKSDREQGELGTPSRVPEVGPTETKPAPYNTASFFGAATPATAAAVTAELPSAAPVKNLTARDEGTTNDTRVLASVNNASPQERPSKLVYKEEGTVKTEKKEASVNQTGTSVADFPNQYEPTNISTPDPISAPLSSSGYSNDGALSVDPEKTLSYRSASLEESEGINKLTQIAPSLLLPDSAPIPAIGVTSGLPKSAPTLTTDNSKANLTTDPLPNISGSYNPPVKIGSGLLELSRKSSEVGAPKNGLAKGTAKPKTDRLAPFFGGKT